MRMTRLSALPMTLAALMCLGVGCGDDDSNTETNGSGDGGGGQNNGTNGDGDGGTNGDGDDDAGTNGGGDDAGTTGSQPTPPLLDGVAGAECGAATDCGPMGTCATELTGGSLSRIGLEPVDTPGGYCSAACTSGSQCGDGGACFGAFMGTSGECRAACASDDDCREGYECAMLNAQLDGTAALFEVPSTCQPLPTTVQLEDDEAGMICATDDDCMGGTCRDGLCTGACTEDAHCGAGGACTEGLYGSAGSCAESCETSADCQNAEMGYGCSADGFCVERLAEGKVGLACTPDTEDVDCPGGSCRESFIGTDYPGGYCVGSCDVDADCFDGGVCINATTCLLGCTDASECREGYDCMIHPSADEDSQSTICYPGSPGTETETETDG